MLNPDMLKSNARRNRIGTWLEKTQLPFGRLETL